MRKITLLCYCILPFLFGPGIDIHPAAQEESTRLRVNVVLVELNVAVTDSKGNYVNGLHPEDFLVTEDKIPEKISSFEENGEPASGVDEATNPAQVGSPDPASAAQPAAQPSADGATISTSHLSGSSVFILFATSN